MTAKGAKWVRVEVLVFDNEMAKANTEAALAELVRCKAEVVRLHLEHLVREWRKQNGL